MIHKKVTIFPLDTRECLEWEKKEEEEMKR